MADVTGYQNVTIEIPDAKLTEDGKRIIVGETTVPVETKMYDTANITAADTVYLMKYRKQIKRRFNGEDFDQDVIDACEKVLKKYEIY